MVEPIKRVVAAEEAGFRQTVFKHIRPDHYKFDGHASSSGQFRLTLIVPDLLCRMVRDAKMQSETLVYN